jgi:hypothetical protein
MSPPGTEEELMLSRPVADALRNLLGQAVGKSEEESALIAQCWVEVRENEAPLPVIHVAEVPAPEVPSENLPPDPPQEAA